MIYPCHCGHFEYIQQYKVSKYCGEPMMPMFDALNVKVIIVMHGKVRKEWNRYVIQMVCGVVSHGSIIEESLPRSPWKKKYNEMPDHQVLGPIV